EQLKELIEEVRSLRVEPAGRRGRSHSRGEPLRARIRFSQSRAPSPAFGLRGARLTGAFLKQRIHDIAFACFFFDSWPYLMSMVLVIAITATVLAFVQNTVMFSLGMKEMAIFAFPLSFVGIFLAEVVLIWAAYFCIRRFLRRSRILVLAGWAIFVLGAAEPMLPASYFTTLVQHAKRKQVLDQIEQTGASIEPLASDQSSIRFALTYELKFPKAGDRKSTRLNSSHVAISYAVFCLKKKSTMLGYSAVHV